MRELFETLSVNALSGLYLISTHSKATEKQSYELVSMPSRAYTSFLREANSASFSFERDRGRFIRQSFSLVGVNALSGLYLISTRIIRYFLTVYWKVSMPSRAYTSFLRYPFKNLGFMRFPEPVFAGIYQNILTTAVFRAC